MLNKHDLKDYEQLPFDPVVKPKHYMLFEELGIEVRDVLAKLSDKLRRSEDNVPVWGTASLFESDYIQMMQYGMRFMEKNGLEDLKKMRWYLDKLIEAYDEQSKTNLGNTGCGKSGGLYGACEQPCEPGESCNCAEIANLSGKE